MKIINNDIAVLENDTHISKWVEQHGTLAHNQSLYNELKYYLRPDDYIVEIGAFIGDNTEFLRRKAKRVDSFEPNPKAFECLWYNARNWDNVTVHNVAIGAGPGTMNIVQDDNVGASYGVDGGDIEVISLDSMQLEQLDFMLVDCEGYELEVLQGARETLIKHGPTIVMEINESTLARRGLTPKDIFNFFDSIKYFYRNIYANEPMQGPQYDILCFKSNL